MKNHKHSDANHIKITSNSLIDEFIIDVLHCVSVLSSFEYQIENIQFSCTSIDVDEVVDFRISFIVPATPSFAFEMESPA